MADEVLSTAAAPTTYVLEFRGTGKEYFRIWIVNLALTILTLGVYSAWAKVRTRRYLYGNTFIADHAFEYHASPLRILIGRLIAVGLLVGYNVSATIHPLYALPWLVVAFFAFPWLVNASIRFNARNTSYRNVRFNFVGRYFEALVAYVIWPIAGLATLFLLMPLARRARDYFYVNYHRFGGRPFRTAFPPWRVYLIYGIAVASYIAFVALVITALVYGSSHMPKINHPWWTTYGAMVAGYAIMVVFYIAFLMLAPAISTMVVNLSVNNTKLDGRHQLRSRMSPLVVAWITVSNAILTLLTVGLFYPWAKVRLRRYQARKLSLTMDDNIDAYVSEAFGTQSAVGEEIGSVFAFDFGL